MAHDLASTNGQTAMMYAGETPWHGLGTKLDNPATATEAINAAGLNYQVELQTVTTQQGIVIPIRKAVVRTDSNEVLGVVGNSYQPVQNHQCFGFLDAVVADGIQTTMRYTHIGMKDRARAVSALSAPCQQFGSRKGAQFDIS